MTVTSATSLLYMFRSKQIEDAVGLVPGMGAEEKLKAVQFWNVVSEKLQEIVNNSAADINALALKMEEENAEKLSLEMERESSDNLVTGNDVCTSDFMNVPPSYAVCDETGPQFGNSSDINSSQVVQYLSEGASLAVMTETSTIPKHLTDSLAHVSSLDQTLTNNDINSTKIDSASHQFSGLPPLTKNSNCVPVQNATECPSEILSAKENLLSNHSSTVLQSQLNSDVSCSSNQRLTTPCQRREKPKRRPVKKLKDNVNASSSQTSSKVASTFLLGSKSLKNACSLRKSSSKLNSIQKNSAENVNLYANRNCDGGDEKEFVTVINSDSNSTTKEADLGSKLEHDSLAESEESSGIDCKESILRTDSVEGKKEATTEIVVIQTEEESSEKSEKGQSKNDSTYICEWCNKQLPNSAALTSHRWTHTKPYLCTECQAQFSTKGNLIVHLRKHTGEKPYCCSQCSARFSTKGNLKRHIKTHSGEKPWQCSQCGSRFTEKKSLKVHMRRHTGEKPYQCQICGKKFAQTGILQTHMAMHLDQKAHLCEHCGKSFRQKSQLRLHMLRHEGVRKYICLSCPARFLTKGDLERHTRVHTGERPFVCELCGKTFTRQQSLNEHMNRHYGLKPYECKYCGKGFAEMSACYKHIKHHERIPNEDDVQKSQSEDTFPQVTSSSPGLQLSSSGTVDQVIEGARGEYDELSPQKFTVILHNNSTALEVGSEMTVVNHDRPDGPLVVSANSEHVTMDLANHISDFAAINLLANASTHQQNF